MTQAQERQAVIDAAMGWRGTPFVWEACIRGLGTDCGRFIAGSINDSVGNHSLPPVDIAKLPHLSPQWFCHRSDESFINVIKQFAVEYELKPGQVPQMADIAVVEMGRDWGHSALVIDWPTVIGAANGFVVTVWQDIYQSPQYGKRRMRFFDLWGKRENV